MSRSITITAGYEPDPENPLDGSGFEMHSFNTRHRNFKDPDTLGFSAPEGRGQEPGRSKKLQKLLDQKKAWICSYYEHGQCVWFLHGETPLGVEYQWDGTRVAGLLVCTLDAKDRKHFKDLDATARSLLESYTRYCNGNVYYVSIDDDEEDGPLDSCAGLDDLSAFFKEHAALLADAKITYRGDLADQARDSVNSVVKEHKKKLVPA